VSLECSRHTDTVLRCVGGKPLQELKTIWDGHLTFQLDGSDADFQGRYDGENTISWIYSRDSLEHWSWVRQDQLCSDCPGCLTPKGKCWEYNPKMAKVDSKGNSMTRKQFSEGCIKNGGIDCSETNLECRDSDECTDYNNPFCDSGACIQCNGRSCTAQQPYCVNDNCVGKTINEFVGKWRAINILDDDEVSLECSRHTDTVLRCVGGKPLQELKTIWDGHLTFQLDGSDADFQGRYDGENTISWIYSRDSLEHWSWVRQADEPKPKDCGLKCNDHQHVTCLACLNDVTPHEYCEKYQKTKGCKEPCKDKWSSKKCKKEKKNCKKSKQVKKNCAKTCKRC